MKVEKAKNFYVSSAIILLNLLVLFVVLNVAIGAVFFIRSLSSASNPIVEKYHVDLLKVYPGKDLRQINALLAETWSRPHVYEPFTQYKEGRYRGHYVNVDEHGFRLSAKQAPWPPNSNAFNIFVFGGSTTFGYGVSDNETIPSFLQEEIRATTGSAVAVYNFGRSSYYSTQERVLFENLLAAGNRPKIAIFIDGLNEFLHPYGRPMYTLRLQDYMASTNVTADLATSTSLDEEMKSLLPLVARLPVVRLIKRIEHRACGWLNDCEVASAARQNADSESTARIILNRYMTNKKMIEAIAAAYNVTPVFVWQPVPSYDADKKSNLFRADLWHYMVPGYSMLDIPIGYSMLAADRQKKPIAGNFLWCADIQEGRHDPLYVDALHYTAAFSKDVAECIAKQLRSAGIIPTK